MREVTIPRNIRHLFGTGGKRVIRGGARIGIKWGGGGSFLLIFQDPTFYYRIG